MGTFKCDYGHVIHDSLYPCPSVGYLLWQPEDNSQSEERHRAVTDFLQAVGSGRKAEWLRGYFGDEYPSDLNDASAIDDIYSKVSLDKGHYVYQCPTWERLYVQKRVFGNEWDCFEKAG